ncbi:hypothetical protein FS842_010502 [Serendipita sp. 407]|nr:hypothetical protein FS842_010502 [Serendipita sp. 407]
MPFTHQLSQFPGYVQLPSATPRFTARPVTAISTHPCQMTPLQDQDTTLPWSAVAFLLSSTQSTPTAPRQTHPPYIQ